MLSAIAHRGPDGIGRFVEDPVALGHAMLRTTSEALGERQPATGAASRPRGLCIELRVCRSRLLAQRKSMTHFYLTIVGELILVAEAKK